jgi:hypothetical protein
MSLLLVLTLIALTPSQKKLLVDPAFFNGTRSMWLIHSTIHLDLREN